MVDLPQAHCQLQSLLKTNGLAVLEKNWHYLLQ
jgi:hypothetical protein